MSVFLLGGHFHNESSFWGKSFCWVFDLLVRCQSSCWQSIFRMSLLSGAGLPVGFLTVGLLICYLGVSLPAGKAFCLVYLVPGPILAWPARQPSPECPFSRARARARACARVKRLILFGFFGSWASIGLAGLA